MKRVSISIAGVVLCAFAWPEPCTAQSDVGSVAVVRASITGGTLQRVPVPLSETAFNPCKYRPDLQTCRKFDVVVTKAYRQTNPTFWYRGDYVTGLNNPALAVPMKVVVCDASKIIRPDVEWPACDAPKADVTVTGSRNEWRFDGVDVAYLRSQKTAIIMWFEKDKLSPTTWSTVFEVTVTEK